MTDEIFFKHVGASLKNWLNYVSAVQRSYVLAENSVIYPVSEFIGTQISNQDEIFLDKEHPNLSGRYLDLRFFKKFDKTKYECAIEFKFSRYKYTNRIGEKRRIFNDLARLMIFLDAKKNRKAYFLICGPQNDFIQAFQSIGWNKSRRGSKGAPTPIRVTKLSDVKDLSKIKPKGFYSKWFKFEIGESKEIDMNAGGIRYKQEVYDKFFSNYSSSFKRGKTETYYRSKKIQTTLVYISEFENIPGISKPMKVGLWEINIA